MDPAFSWGMDVKSGAKKAGTAVVRRKLIRAIPLVGPIFAVFHVAETIREKGPARGGLDAALDLTPVVGRAKALYEAFKGDIIAAPPGHATA